MANIIITRMLSKSQSTSEIQEVRFRRESGNHSNLSHWLHDDGLGISSTTAKAISLHAKASSLTQERKASAS
jgi:hypothetical protein